LKIDQELQNKIKKLARELNIDGLLPKIYELALLRVLARIAEGSLGLTRSVNDDYVAAIWSGRGLLATSVQARSPGLTSTDWRQFW
jgi:hypothetical protein